MHTQRQWGKHILAGLTTYLLCMMLHAQDNANTSSLHDPEELPAGMQVDPDKSGETSIPPSRQTNAPTKPNTPPTPQAEAALNAETSSNSKTTPSSPKAKAHNANTLPDVGLDPKEAPIPPTVWGYLITAPIQTTDDAIAAFQAGALEGEQHHDHGSASQSLIPLFCGFPLQLVDPNLSLQWIMCAPIKEGGEPTSALVLPTSKYQAILDGLERGDIWTKTYFRKYADDGSVLLMRSTSGWPEFMVPLPGEGVILGATLEGVKQAQSILQGWRRKQPGTGSAEPLFRMRLPLGRGYFSKNTSMEPESSEAGTLNAWLRELPPALGLFIRVPAKMASTLASQTEGEIQCDIHVDQRGVAIQGRLKMEHPGALAAIIEEAKKAKPSYAMAPYFPKDTSALMACMPTKTTEPQMLAWLLSAWEQTGAEKPAPVVIRAAAHDVMKLADSEIYCAILGTPDERAHLVVACKVLDTDKMEQFATNLGPHLKQGAVIWSGSVMTMAFGPKSTDVAKRVSLLLDEETLGLGTRQKMPPPGFIRTELGMGVVFGTDLCKLLLGEMMKQPLVAMLPPAIHQYLTEMESLCPASKYPLVITLGVKNGMPVLEAGIGSGAMGELVTLYEGLMRRTVDFYNKAGNVQNLMPPGIKAPFCGNGCTP